MASRTVLDLYDSVGVLAVCAWMNYVKRAKFTANG